MGGSEQGAASRAASSGHPGGAAGAGVLRGSECGGASGGWGGAVSSSSRKAVRAGNPGREAGPGPTVRLLLLSFSPEGLCYPSTEYSPFQRPSQMSLLARKSATSCHRASRFPSRAGAGGVPQEAGGAQELQARGTTFCVSHCPTCRKSPVPAQNSPI